MKRTQTDLIRESLARFGVTGTLRKISDGLDQSFRVRATDNRVYALRVSIGEMMIRSVSAYEVEAEWIEALSDGPWLRIPRVVRTTDGRRVGQVISDEGRTLPCTLLTWLPGRRRFRLDPAYARALGRGIAVLHRDARRRSTPPPGAIKTWDAPFMCSMFRKERVDRFPSIAGDVVGRVFEKLQRVVSEMDAAEIGLINADVGVHNIVWHRRVPGFVDFNDSGIGPYAFCLGRLMERVRSGRNGDALADDLLAGYREVAPLPEDYASRGRLFEIAAALFRFDFSQARIEARGTRLEPRERRRLAALQSTLDSLGF